MGQDIHPDENHSQMAINMGLGTPEKVEVTKIADIAQKQFIENQLADMDAMGRDGSHRVGVQGDRDLCRQGRRRDQPTSTTTSCWSRPCPSPLSRSFEEAIAEKEFQLMLQGVLGSGSRSGNGCTWSYLLLRLNRQLQGGKKFATTNKFWRKTMSGVKRTPAQLSR